MSAGIRRRGGIYAIVRNIVFAVTKSDYESCVVFSFLRSFQSSAVYFSNISGSLRFRFRGENKRKKQSCVQYNVRYFLVMRTFIYSSYRILWIDIFYGKYLFRLRN